MKAACGNCADTAEDPPILLMDEAISSNSETEGEIHDALESAVGVELLFQ